jgi:6,7-dimethyl-8-ribityllumazine synthase
MSTKAPAFVLADIPKDARVAVVAARFNGEIVDVLLADCVGRLREMGIGEERITVERVPGAFELPVAARAFCATGRYAAVVCLGAVVRGDTPHFDYVAGNCAEGIRQVSLEYGVPVIFGVLTTNTEEQALARTHGPHSRNGVNAAEAAGEMIAVVRRIAGGGGGKSNGKRAAASPRRAGGRAGGRTGR